MFSREELNFLFSFLDKMSWKYIVSDSDNFISIKKIIWGSLSQCLTILKDKTYRDFWSYFCIKVAKSHALKSILMAITMIKGLRLWIWIQSFSKKKCIYLFKEALASTIRNSTLLISASIYKSWKLIAGWNQKSKSIQLNGE